MGVGVVITNDHRTIDVKPGRAVPVAVMEVPAALREQRWSMHLMIAVSFWLGSCEMGTVATGAENESAKLLFLTVIVSMTFVMTWGGT